MIHQIPVPGKKTQYPTVAGSIRVSRPVDVQNLPSPPTLSREPLFHSAHPCMARSLSPRKQCRPRCSSRTLVEPTEGLQPSRGAQLSSAWNPGFTGFHCAIRVYRFPVHSHMRITYLHTCGRPCWQVGTQPSSMVLERQGYPVWEAQSSTNEALATTSL